jgi:hypothetical protein
MNAKDTEEEAIRNRKRSQNQRNETDKLGRLWRRNIEQARHQFESEKPQRIGEQIEDCGQSNPSKQSNREVDCGNDQRSETHRRKKPRETQWIGANSCSSRQK